MKRTIVAICVAATLISLCPMGGQAAEREPGGAPAFFIGCCFGLRQGLQWNEGVDLHWREWAHVFTPIAIWNGIDCASGTTAHDWAEANGASWY